MRYKLIGLLALALVLVLPTGAGAEPGPAAARGLTVATDVSELTVAPLPCAKQRFTLLFTNNGSKAVYGDAWLTAPAPLTLSRTLVTSYLPAGYTLRVPITVTAPTGAAPGDRAITITAGASEAKVQAHVAMPDLGGNLAREATVTASSQHGSYPACGAADGNRNSDDWGTTTGWNDSSSGIWPDWIGFALPQATTISKVDVYTLDSAKYPAARYGLSEWNVQVRDGDTWRTVDEIRGNTVGRVTSTFDPVSTDAVRILCLANNNGDYSRLIEVEIYAS